MITKQLPVLHPVKQVEDPTDPRNTNMKCSLALAFCHYFGLNSIVRAHIELVHMSFEDKCWYREQLMDPKVVNPPYDINEWDNAEGQAYRKGGLKLPLVVRAPEHLSEIYNSPLPALPPPKQETPPQIPFDADGPNYHADDETDDKIKGYRVGDVHPTSDTKSLPMA